jgi:hypothetical protein
VTDLEICYDPEGRAGRRVAEAETTGLSEGGRQAYLALIAEAQKLRAANAEQGAELDAYRNGVGQLAMDPPSLSSPRVAAVHEGIPVFFLQQTHNGVPAWICADCIRFVLGQTRPDRCIGCGGDGEGHLSEMLYPKVLIDQDEPDRILSE